MSNTPDVPPDNIDVQTWFNPEYLNFQRPEVGQFLGGLTFDPEITDTIVSEDRARGLLAEGGYTRSADLEIPVDGGTIDIAKLSQPVTERIAERDEALLPGLSGFAYRYTTVNGATEGIDQLMSGFAADTTIQKVGLVRGDYLGYFGAALTKGIQVQWADSLEEVGDPKDGVVWFVSNPSAINGNLYEADVWETFLGAGHKVVVDAAYVDLTPEGNAVDVRSENILAVLTSPSKPFGFVLDKYPGVVYTKERHGGLHLLKKFNNIPRLLTILEVQLQEQFGPHKIAELHLPTQLAICRTLGALAGGAVLPSHATLMAHATDQLHQDFDRYKTVNLLERAQDYTFRLSKEFARRALLEGRRQQV